MFKFSWGKYYQRSSVIHRLDARLKCVLIPLFSVSCFFANQWFMLAAAFGIVCLLYRLAQVPLSGITAALRPLRYLLIFIAFITLFTFENPDIALGAWGESFVFGVSYSGFNQGLLSVARLSVFVAGTSLLSYTTPLVEISDSLTSFMKPLERLGLPAQDISLLTMLTLRFIPQAIEEGNRLIVAQKSRGLSFDTGSFARRVQAWVPIMVPLFVNTIRLSERTAVALEARCYQGAGRTRLNESALNMRTSLLGLALCLLWVVALVVARFLG